MPLHLKNLLDELKPLQEGKQSTLRYKGPLDEREMAELVKAIPELPSLTLLNLEEAYLKPDDVKALSTALAKRSDLQELGLGKSPISQEDACQLADALSQHRNFRALQVPYCDMEADAMGAFSEVIARSPNFRSLTASGNKWNQRTLDKLALAIGDKPDLSALALPRNDALDEQLLEKSLLQSPHPNLYSCTGIESKPIAALVRRNLDTRVAASNFINVISANGNSYEQIANASTMNLALMDSIFKTQTRRSAVFEYARSTSGLAAFDDFLNQMPKLEAKDSVSIDALFKEDAHGIAPVENPLTWQNHPKMLQELAKNGELSAENRQRKTSRDTKLFEAALSYLPAKSVLEQIHPFGLKIGRDELLTEDNTPTKALNILFSKGEVAQLFGFKNWIGQNKHELTNFAASLPAEMKPCVPPLLALSQQLDMSRASTQRGR